MAPVIPELVRKAGKKNPVVSDLKVSIYLTGL